MDAHRQRVDTLYLNEALNVRVIDILDALKQSPAASTCWSRMLDPTTGSADSVRGDVRSATTSAACPASRSRLRAGRAPLPKPRPGYDLRRRQRVIVPPKS